MKTYTVLKVENTIPVALGTLFTEKLANQLAQKLDPKFDPKKPLASEVKVCESMLLMPSQIESM